MSTIHIDTTDNKKTVITIEENGEKIANIKNYSSPKADAVLKDIEETLKKTNTNLSDITEIEVNNGPGSYTGTRVGVTVANALSFALDIPVNNKKQAKAIYS